MENQIKRHPIFVLLVTFFTAFWMLLAAQDAGGPAQVEVPLGKKMKIKGVIVKRAPDRFTLRDEQGSEITVLPTHQTVIKEKKNNFFRKAINYSTEDLLLGLDVQVEGRGDFSGNLLAEQIKFTQDDLKAAKIINSRVSPIEKRVDEAHARVDETEQHLEQHAQAVSGHILELNDAFRTVRGETQQAQESADQAQKTGDQALSRVDAVNDRVTALDEYQETKVLMIQFKFDSANLSEEAKAELDGLVNQAKNLKGFLIEVTGFASADGDETYNHRLSQRRAESVVDYLSDKHEIPLRRIISPHGYGEMYPLAENSSLEGRKQNRRVEVRLLVNRGLIETATVGE